MSWFKVDDGLYAHPKILALRSKRRGAGALALWLLAGSWSAQQLTDGQIPLAVVAMLGANEAEADALVEVGLWVRTSDGYAFHDWLDRNPSRAKVVEKREKTARKVAAWRADKSSDEAAGNPPSNPVTTTVTNRARNRRGKRVSNPAPVPSRPDPRSPVPPEQDPGPSRDDSDPGSPSEERIATLESRYPGGLAAAARAACARHRRSGRMAPAVWLATLEKLDAYAPEIVVGALATFVDRYSTGEHDERYLLGIVRNESERGTRANGWRPPTTREEYAAAATSESELAAMFDSVTDEDRARIERLGNRRAHG